jgi:hypothetical protein
MNSGQALSLSKPVLSHAEGGRRAGQDGLHYERPPDLCFDPSSKDTNGL